MKLKFLIQIIFLIVLPIQVYAIDPLQFSWIFQQSEYTVFKGGYVDIGYSISNKEDAQITCTVSPTGLSSQQVIVVNKGVTARTFRYNAPSKIKNLQNPISLQVTVYCIGSIRVQTSLIGCGTLFLNSCYKDEKRDWTHPQAVKISFQLSDQDQKNLNLLEDYRKTLSDKIIDIDKKSQKINELISKTPNPILPKNSKEQNAENQKRIDTIKNRFQEAVKALEDEDYGLGSSISTSNDLIELSNADNIIIDLTNNINTNIKKYNEIVSNLNSLLKDATDKSSKFKYRFNTELINKLDELGKTTYSKINTYQFLDLIEANNIVYSYSKEKDEILSEMEKNINKFFTQGINELTNQLDNLCTNFKLCETKNKVKNTNLEFTKNFNDLCNSFKEFSQEIQFFNEKEVKRYNTELEDLNKKNIEIQDKNVVLKKEIDEINRVNELKDNLNKQVTGIEKEIQNLLKIINKFGKTISLSQYNKLVEDYNTISLEKKTDKIKEIEASIIDLKSKILIITEEEKGFGVFFKKIYYTVFGKKQKIEVQLKLEVKYLVPSLIPKIPNRITPVAKATLEATTENFIVNICQISEKELSQLSGRGVTISISEKESQIKTEFKEAEKSCLDDSGQRTTQCCDGDEYKSRVDFYPIVFVHGHAMEKLAGGRGDVQTSLNTFDFMSKYFSENGYVEKSIFYPESSELAIKGSWTYCNKPVVVRLTYYEGLLFGTTHNYKESIAEYSPTLKKEIDAILTNTNKDKVIIVAHSMGGVLSRYYINNDGGKEKVHKLITIASPHYGIRSGAQFLSFLGAKESKQMTPNSEFLKSLNNPIDSLVPTFTICGNNKGCLTEDCDGLVYVNSCRLKTETKNMIFTGTQYEHSPMLQQREVAQQVLDFIRN